MPGKLDMEKSLHTLGFFFYYDDEITAARDTKMSNLCITSYQALLSLAIGHTLNLLAANQ
jgi:hypothetical protein